MANIIDATAPVSITIVAQGFADILSIVANPNPAGAGSIVTVTDTVKNSGSTDIIWIKNYVNSTQIGSTWSGSVTGGQNTVLTWTFTMPTSNAVVVVEAGHMVGTTQVMDDSMQITVTLLALPEGTFVGIPTYNPGQQVEPGTQVTISYQAQNIGGTGILWGGLYDYAPIPNLIGGYWEQNVTSGTTIPKSVTVTVNENLDAQLLVGHFE
jgi:hypothetical protein